MAKKLKVLSVLSDNCFACAYASAPPDEPLTCCHEKAGFFGRYVEHRDPIAACGPTRSLFQQHTGRNPDGSLKSAEATL